MSVSHLLHLRLLLEGVEIPVVAADVQSVPGSPAVAAIQIPANDFAMDMKPRTLVHLFSYDYHNTGFAGTVSVQQKGLRVAESPGLAEGEIAAVSGTDYENNEELSITDIENQGYNLIFGGEVMGISLQKTATSRGIVLQCADFSSYWDIALQYMVSGYSLGGGGMKARFGNYNTTLFRDFFRGSADIITRIMSTAPKSHKNLKGTLLGGLMNLIEAIGGTYFGENAVRGTNDFFSMAEIRLHLTQMVGANPFPSGDEKRLLRARGFNSLFRRSLSGLGKQVSIRAVLNALEKYIFHQVVPITSPRYIPSQLDPNEPSTETIKITQDKSARPIVGLARALQKHSNDLVERIEANIYSSVEANAVSDERGGLRNELVSMIKQAQKAEGVARSLGQRDATGGSTEGDFSGLPEAAQAFASASGRLSRVLTLSTSGGVVKLPTGGTSKANRAIRLLTEVRGLMRKVLSTKRQARIKKGFRQPDPPPRLLQQIYRPDVWMVAPPRCNVLFPELYTQFSYARDFNAEVTRLLLRTNDAMFGSGILFDGFYFSPSQLRGQRTGRANRGKAQDVGDRPAHIVKDMMEHELNTGVIPTFERMSDLNLHALRRNGHVKIDGKKIGFAQLAANHIFFQYRFRSRNLSVEGRFNPYFALGFPALVIDKYQSDDGLRTGSNPYDVERAILDEQEKGEGLGLEETTQAQIESAAARSIELLDELRKGREEAHYLGTPVSVSHSLNARMGGRTSIDMSYARTTNERMEFLGETKRVVKTARKNRKVTKISRVASLVEPKVGMRGPRGGEITEVKDITDVYGKKNRDKKPSNQRSAVTGEKLPRGTTLPLFVPSHRFVGRSRDRNLRVLVGVEQPVAHYGPTVVSMVGVSPDTQTTGDDATTLLMVSGYKITEEIWAYRRKEYDMPPEDVVFPPWYGEKYRTVQVGGLYNYFFGTGSIVDPLEVGLGGSSSEAVQYSDGQSEDGLAAEITDADDVGLGDAGEPVAVNSDEMIGPSIGSIEAGTSIGDAVYDLVNIYSKVKSEGADVNNFIRGYTWRPIATAMDILGTSDLDIDDKGNVVRGLEGFHSRAFGDYDDLRTLVSQEDASGGSRVLGLRLDGSEEEAAISARLDTRKEKRQVVLKYLHALLSSRGILG